LGGLWFKTSSKITRAKWTGGVAQVVRIPALQAQNPVFMPQSHQKKVVLKKGKGASILEYCYSSLYFKNHWCSQGSKEKLIPSLIDD
jgi:3-deoxy-D-arabino-heptulosonate 7-phosphate (DAHP) synthase